MKRKNLDKVIGLIREMMAVGTGGFSASSDQKGPVAGFDPVMNNKNRKKYIFVRGVRKNWKKKDASK